MSKFTSRPLNKFLTRTPDRDFSDDGTKFTTYTYRGLRVTYAAAEGKVYLDADAPGDIPYNFVYKYKEFYHAASQFNGVLNTDPELTPANVKRNFDLAADILHNQIIPAWEKEKAIVMTNENIAKTRQMYIDHVRDEVAKMQALTSQVTFDTILKLDKYDISSIKDYYKSKMQELDHKVGTWVPGYDTVRAAIDSNFQYAEKQESFYLETIRKILGKVGIR